KWRLVECKKCSEEDRFFIELSEKVHGKVLVVDHSRINVYPPMAGLAPKNEGNQRQMWKLDEPNGQRQRFGWNRLQCQ
ncbi:hypothetical protein BGX26_012095, partial [Mortierella sp. AD094]